MDENTVGSVVTLKDKHEQLTISQSWLRSFANIDGFFTLKNPTSGHFLTAKSIISTTNTGNLKIIPSY